MPSDDTEWVCMPCFTMVPDRTGHVTAHGEGYSADGATLTVWCPWCGDRMDPAEENLTVEEFRSLHTDTDRPNGGTDTHD